MAEYLPIRDPDQIEISHSSPDEVERSNDHQHRVWISTKWIVIPLFLLLGAATVGVWIIHFLGGIPSLIAFGLILSYNLIGSVMGATMVYKYSDVFAWYETLKLDNEWFLMEVMELDEEREQIHKNAEKIHFSVMKLKKISKDLDEQWKQFDSLRTQLAEICHKNEEINDKLSELTEICDDLREAKAMNERAHLMSIYFSLCSKSANRKNDFTQTSKLNRTEFEQMMERLDSKNRKRINQKGGFDAMDKNKDGTVDVNEFIKMIDEILNIYNN